MKRYSVASLPLMALAAAGLTVASTDRRVEERVDSRIRAQVAAVVDSLEKEGVPSELLIQYALEGTNKRGSPQVIVTGVRKWARDLRRARQLLGPNASALEVSAGAQAIRSGDPKALINTGTSYPGTFSKSSARFFSPGPLQTRSVISVISSFGETGVLMCANWIRFSSRLT